MKRFSFTVSGVSSLHLWGVGSEELVAGQPSAELEWPLNQKRVLFGSASRFQVLLETLSATP